MPRWFHERRIDLAYDTEYRLGFEGGTVQAIANLSQKPGIQCLGIQPPQRLTLLVSYSHKGLLPDNIFFADHNTFYR